jgi:hypothetical protein
MSLACVIVDVFTDTVAGWHHGRLAGRCRSAAEYRGAGSFLDLL